MSEKARKQEDAANATAVVVASSPQAAQAGLAVLEKGGNAVDAAFAATLALCVTDPVNVSIAGRLHAVLAEPQGRTHVIDGASQSPKQLPAMGPIPIPGLPAALTLMHERFGRLNQSELFAPAIQLAAKGFRVGPEIARVWQRREPELDLHPQTRALFLPKGRAPVSRDEFRQPVLAEFLKELGERGLRYFYQHIDVAREGPWPAAELRAHQARMGRETRLELDGCQLVTTGPQAWGPVLAHLLDQLMHMSDEPDLLLRSDKIARACSDALKGKNGRASWLNADLDTTHLVVTDSDGRMVSLTASIGPHFGAKRAHPSLGFLYPWSYQMMAGGPPGTRDVTEMCPAILLDHGRPWIAIGAAGSERIPQAIAQCLYHRLLARHSLPDAVNAPRLVAIGDQVRLWHDVENTLLSKLARLGWQVERAGPGHVDHVGIVHACERGPDGRVSGVADRAYDGSVVYGMPQKPRI